MYDYRQFYIDGEWVGPATPNELGVVDPATEAVIGKIALGAAGDVDRAVTAARAALPAFAQTSRKERLALLEQILDAYRKRYDEFARAISDEMGAPMWLATRAQAAMGVAHLQTTIDALKRIEFEHRIDRWAFIYVEN